jgi:alpha-1,3-rhamnosyl/mannosyltransferase
MRVIYNQFAGFGPKTGIGHYTAELLAALRSLGEPARVDGFPQGWFRDARRMGVKIRPYLDAPGLCRRSLRAATLSLFRKAADWAQTRQFQRLCADTSYSVYHEPNYNPLDSDLPTIATIHDLSVLLHPEWHPADRVRYFEARFPKTLERCAHFIAGSESTRRQIIQVLGVKPSRVTRIYYGIRPNLRPLPADIVKAEARRLGLPPRFLLMLGTLEPRKNALRLLQAYCAMGPAMRARWPLLVVGGWGWNSAPVARYLNDVARHRGVIHMGYLAEEHLAVLYNAARALVYPSLYEGFGLPPLEMMACGGAVIASKAEAVVETAGRYACLVHPQDVDGWRHAMERMVSDDQWWRCHRESGVELAGPFTWERCARQTMAVYRAVAEPSVLEFPTARRLRRAA